MLSFGWITIQNVKRIRQLVNPHITTNNGCQHSLKRKDRQMITMLFIQVILFSICVIPAGISKAYSTLTFNQNKDSLELTKENFFFQVKSKKKTFILIDSTDFFILDFGTYLIYQLLLCILYLYIIRYDISSRS